MRSPKFEAIPTMFESLIVGLKMLGFVPKNLDRFLVLLFITAVAFSLRMEARVFLACLLGNNLNR